MHVADNLIVKSIVDPGSGNEVMEIVPQEMPAWGALYQSTTSTLVASVGTTPVKITGWDSQMWSPRIMIPNFTTTNTITLGSDPVQVGQRIAVSVNVRCTFLASPPKTLLFWIEYDYGAGYAFNNIWRSDYFYTTGAPSPLEFYKRYVLSCLSNSYLALYVSCAGGPVDISMLAGSFMILERIA